MKRDCVQNHLLEVRYLFLTKLPFHKAGDLIKGLIIMKTHPACYYISDESAS